MTQLDDLCHWYLDFCDDHLYFSAQSPKNIRQQCGWKMRPPTPKLECLVKSCPYWSYRKELNAGTQDISLFSPLQKRQNVFFLLCHLYSVESTATVFIFVSSIAWSIGLLVFVSPFEKSGRNLLSSNIQSQKESSETKRQEEVEVNPIARIKSDFIRTDSDILYA